MNPPNSNALPWLALSALLMGLDQYSKYLAITHLIYQQPVPVLPGFWNWTLTHNTGAAFSFLAHADGWQHIFFITLAIVISFALVIALKRTPYRAWRTALPFSLIIAGALGNVIDRFRFGYVIDFIQWYWRDFYWPVFNIADSCIVVGAGLMVLFSFNAKDNKQ